MKPISFKTHIDILNYLKTSYLEIPETVVKKIGGIGKQRLICEVNKTIKLEKPKKQKPYKMTEAEIIQMMFSNKEIKEQLNQL